MHGKRLVWLGGALLALFGLAGPVLAQKLPVIATTAAASDCGCSEGPPPRNAVVTGTQSPQGRRARAQWSAMPLQFEPNVGQAAAPVKFLARGGGYRLALTGHQAELIMGRKSAHGKAGVPAALRMTLVGHVNPAPVALGTDKMRGKINYLVGNDPKRWHTNIPTFRAVQYANVYQGINLKYYGSGGKLEYDFQVAPGVSPRIIRLAFAGTGRPRITNMGALRLPLAGGSVGWQRPVAYQTVSGKRHTVAARFALRTDGTVGFALGRYDARLPLTIDPVLIYSTYLGGAGDEFAYSVAVDQNGLAYLTGDVIDPPSPSDPASDFPVKASPQNMTGTILQQGNGGGNDPANSTTDAFVAQFDTTQSGYNSLVYATYLGGSGDDHGRGIAVDSAGSAYVAGYTTSSDFPTTSGELDTTFAGGPNANTDAFVTKLSADGSALGYSTYLGGAGDDFAYGIAVNTNNNAYVVGSTGSDQTTFLPAPSSGAIKPTLAAGDTDGFLAVLKPDGTGATYSTFIGGSGADTAFAVALNTFNPSSPTAYITGNTLSTDLGPLSTNAFQIAQTGTGTQAFALALDPTKSGSAAATYFSYLGGHSNSTGNAVAFGPDNNMYVVGSTTGNDFPTTPGGEQTTRGGGSDAFLAVFNPAAMASAARASLVYSTFIGGTGDDFGTGVAVQASPTFGNPGAIATITGYTNSINQADATPPGTNNEFNPTNNTNSNSAFQQDNGGQIANPGAVSFDAFMAQIDTGQSGTNSLTYLSFLGGSGDESDPNSTSTGGPGCAVAVGPAGQLFVSGSTNSTDFKVTGSDTIPAYQPNNGGGVDAFLAKITFNPTLDDNTGLLLPTSACGNIKVLGFVSLNGAAANDTIINLSADNPNVQFLDANSKVINSPVTVTIPAGSTAAAFFVRSGQVNSATTVNVTAVDPGQGTQKNVAITFNSPALKSLQLNGKPTVADPVTQPMAGSGSTVNGAVALTCPANSGGQTVYLTSSDPLLAPVPASVQVSQLTTAITFSFTAGSVTTPTQVTVSASEMPGGMDQTVTLTISPASLSSLTASPNPVVGGNTTTGTITLNGVSGAGGTQVALTSSNATASVPATVTIPAGATSATFPISTQSVQANVNVTLTATYNGSSVSLQPLVVEPLAVSSLTFSPTSVLSGSTSTGTVTVNEMAPAGGLTVTLSSTPTGVTLPATVTILQGQNSATFTATALPLSQTTPVLVTASINNNPQSATLTVIPVLVSSLTATPSTVSGGTLVTLTVNLSVAAPTGGVSVKLSSTDPAHLPVPAQLFISGGRQSVSIGVVAQGVSATTTAVVSAQYATTPPQTATVTIKGANVQSLTLSPSSVPGGGLSTATLTLDSDAPTGGAVVGLSSSNGAASVPSSVTVPSGASQVTFPVQAHPVSSTQTPTITASFNNSSASATLTVTPVVGGAFSGGLQLFSVPYDYPITALDDLFGYTGVKLAVYVPSALAYAVTPTAPADHVRLGRGYWVRFPQAVSVTRTGTPADPTQDFALALDAGWNQIGDPFLISVAVANLTVTSGDNTDTFAAATSGTSALVYGTLYRYPGGDGKGYISVGSGDSLTPGTGYWIYAFQRVTLTFPHP